MQTFDILELVHNIQYSTSEQEALQNIKYLLSLFKKVAYQQIDIITLEEICQNLNKILVDSKTSIQLELLNIIEQISEAGYDLAERNSQNKFFNQFDNSGITDQVHLIIHNEVENGNKNEGQQNKFSDLLQKSVIIFSFIKKCNYVNNKDRQICGLVLKFHILQLFNKLKELLDQNRMKEEQIMQSKKQVANTMIQLTQILKSIQGIVEYRDIQRYFANTVEMHKTLVNFLHLNCHSNIRCTHCIILPNTTEANELQYESLRVLSEISYMHNTISDYLIYNHAALFHVGYIICSYVDSHLDSLKQSNQNDCNIPMNQFYTSPNHSKQVVAQALHLLSTIINNDRNRSKLAIQVPGLVVSLTKLVQFDQKHYLRYMSNRDSRQILISGFKSLGSICLYSDYFTVRRLIREWRFPQILAELTTSKGQEDEIWKEMLKNSLHYVGYIIISLRKQQQWRPALPDFAKKIEEAFEGEGCIEEINMYLIGSISYYPLYFGQYAFESLINRFENKQY